MPRQWLRRFFDFFRPPSEPPPVDRRRDDLSVVSVGRPESQCEVVVGVDFGTSATKVVVRTPYLPGEHAVPVDFRDVGQADNTFLIPSQLWITEGTVCRLAETEAAQCAVNLKVDLFEPRPPWTGDKRESLGAPDPEPIATAYLALVLIRSQRWFKESQKDVIGHFTSFNWSFNLGVPSPHVGDNSQSRGFWRVGAAAWMLAEDSLHQGRNSVALDKATECLERAEKMRMDTESDRQLTCDFNIVPEIVAATVGYARSNERNDGLHMMIDVGAATMDVCSFLLVTHQGDDSYSLCTADVDFLGVVKLEASSGRDRSDIQKKCDRMLRLAVKECITDKAPNESAWKPGNSLPVLLIGGGSNVTFYQNLLGGLEQDIRHWFFVNNDGVSRLRLPVPDTIAHNKTEFHRLAVA